MTRTVPAPGIQPASAEDTRAVFAGLLAFNQAASGDALDDQPVNRVIHDAAGQVVAGIAADVCGGWLMVHALWVDDAHRGEGLGQALLADAEHQARTLGAHAVTLDTFSWQAEGFYRKQGYEVFGWLQAFPPGHQRLYLRKRL
ncbi:GNAT family N-acetyltransferase [Stenotrophomonas sp. JAI102]|uniref:GNAT family N-acetyltransferase n=1 Tax=Stenotrophomonas sp. JAI102 TaxID=2723077 RepID=UPI0015CADCD2|nr:GNAT family N-acetyltransferase [Stenotrophomonas sp. JAI102]NYF35437.1 GNAT superfamily N-acetyltransferase [Stenotrophomonas sp. JAI102]